MPAVSGEGGGGGAAAAGGSSRSPAGDDLGTMDEVKVFKDEGEDENEQNASESLQAELLEEKSSLLAESEQFLSKIGDLRRPDASIPVPGVTNPFGMGYLFNPYAAYANGAAQLSRGSSPLSPFLDPLGSPPPAHMGALRPGSLYPLPPQYAGYGGLGMEQLAAWHQASMYHTHHARSGYPPGLGRPAHPGAVPHPHPGLGFPQLPPHHLPHVKPDFDRPPGLLHPDDKDNHSPKKKEPHIKKPLNAFMLYMKEMRPVVQAECTLKESAAINQILGRRWHSLSREEQAKYYEKARIERQRHMQLYPHWNARDNYRYGAKKKKRKRDKSDDPAASMKKCRARYGLDQQNLWCKPCRRKKKCIRVQMYLAGKSEQEIEATTFDEEGEAIPPLNSVAGPGPGTRAGPGLTSHSCSSVGSDASDASGAGSPASQESAVSDSQSLTSPAPCPSTPGGGPLSIPSPFSPASIASPSTPGGAEDWFRGSVSGYRPAPARPPVGTDPRDSKNPLSISSLTSCQPRQNGINGNDKMLGVT